MDFAWWINIYATVLLLKSPNLYRWILYKSMTIILQLTNLKNIEYFGNPTKLLREGEIEGGGTLGSRA